MKRLFLLSSIAAGLMLSGAVLASGMTNEKLVPSHQLTSGASTLSTESGTPRPWHATDENQHDKDQSMQQHNKQQSDNHGKDRSDREHDKNISSSEGHAHPSGPPPGGQDGHPPPG